MEKERKNTSPEQALSGIESFWKKHGAGIIMGVLFFYVILLAIGTYADLFKIQSILDWWIFKT